MSCLQNNLRTEPRYGSRDSVDENARLPKTMPHWFREHGIKFDANIGAGYGTRTNHRLGCGSPVRHFRALPHLGVLQICDGYFDRWANSVGAETALPKTRAEFTVAIKYLLSVAKIADIDPEKEIASLVDDLRAVNDEIAELQLNNADLAAHVRYFGRSKRWIGRLWKRHLRKMAYLRSRRVRIAKEIKFQKGRAIQGDRLRHGF